MTDGLLWAEMCNLGGILLTGLLFTHSFSNKLQHSPLWLTGIAKQVFAFKKSWRSFSSIHCIWDVKSKCGMPFHTFKSINVCEQVEQINFI